MLEQLLTSKKQRIPINPGTWTSRTMSGGNRFGHTTGGISGKLYMTGGYSGTGYLTDTWEYNPAGAVWTAKATNPVGGDTGCGVVNAGLLWCFGGYTTAYSSALSNYNPATNVWTPRQALSVTQQMGSIAAYNDRLYLWGGNSSFGNATVVNLMQEYNIATNTWATIPVASGNTPSARRGHTVTTIENKMYLFGGADASSIVLGDLWEYDFIARTWTQKVSGPPIRYLHGAIVIDGRLMIMGGRNAGGLTTAMNDMWEYDTVLNQWRQFTMVNAPTVRSEHSMAIADNRLFVTGGRSATAPLNNMYDCVLS